MDPAALAGLLELTGPVTLPGRDVVLDAANVEQFLYVDQYVLIGGANPERSELLGDVARATFDALTSQSLPGISDLTETLGPLVSAGHLRLSVTQPDAEVFLDRVGLSGRWTVAPGGDYLSVRSDDLLANKIDSFLHRDIDVSSRVDPGSGEVRSVVTVTLRNDAPAEGLPDYVIGNTLGVPTGHEPEPGLGVHAACPPIGAHRRRVSRLPDPARVRRTGPHGGHRAATRIDTHGDLRARRRGAGVALLAHGDPPGNGEP